MAKTRFVQLYTWYKDQKDRTFVVVDKTGRHIDGVYYTTKVSLLEVGTDTPTQLEVQEFFQYIDLGKLKPFTK